MKNLDYILHDNENIKGFVGRYTFLSNFEPCEIYYESIKYGSVECAYQAQKTLDISKKIEFSSISASASKYKSRELVIRDDWELIKFNIMFSLVYQKFSNNCDLKNKLISTGSKYIEETNWWKDCYWGVCDNKGDNNLGKILMKVREIILMNPSQKGFLI